MVSAWHKSRRRGALRRACVAAWLRPGHQTQEMIGAGLGISKAHVGVLLREAGVRIGAGKNTPMTPRRRRRGRFVAANPTGIKLAVARWAEVGPTRPWGALKRVAMECGVPDSTLVCRLRRAAA